MLRVGYLPDALPFAFVNQAGDLVGFDIELAHDLARELGVTLAFVPVDRDTMAAQLADGYCDLVMSGVAVTTERARDLLLSDSYLDETMALSCPIMTAIGSRRGRQIRDRGAADDRGARCPLLRRASCASCCRTRRSPRNTMSRRGSPDAPPALMRLPCRPSGDRHGRSGTRLTPSSCRDRIRSGCRSPTRSANAMPPLAQIRQHVDRTEAQGRHLRRRVSSLDSRTRRHARSPAMVDRPRRAALDGVSHG